GIGSTPTTVQRRSEQERAAPRTRPGDLYFQAGAYRRPRSGRAAIPRLRAEPDDRRYRSLEFDLPGRRYRPLAPTAPRRSRRTSGPYLATHMGAYRLLRRLPLGPGRCHGRTTPAPEPHRRQDGCLISCTVFTRRSLLALFS